jgi:Asp-tRNA(Asn)/Glu-tRNA(Gln) amidotransferase A subunit family amidase
LGAEPSPDDLEPLTWKAMQSAGVANSTDYVAAIASLNAVCRRVASFFEKYHVLLTPTMAKPPLLRGTLRNQSDEYAVHRRKVRDYSPFTGIFNVTGQPAISLPLGWTNDELPIGVQLASAFGREDILLRLSSQLEAAAPWAGRAPALSGVQ